MSMMAIGAPTASRPGAPCPRRSGTLSTLQGPGARRLERLAAPGEARVRHEVLVRVERLLAGSRLDALARARAQYPPALLVVEEVRDHDLVEHLLVHGRVEDRQQGLDPAVEVALHEVRGGDVDGRDRKSTRLNSSHANISYAVFCLKKKTIT